MKWYPSLLNHLRKKQSSANSQHRQIAIGFLWVSLFVFVGKLAGAAKEIAIAWRYGVSATVDAYVFIFNLVSWPVSIWATILFIVLVPLVVRLQRENPQELKIFSAEMLGMTTLLGSGLGLIAWLTATPLLSLGWLGFSDSALAAALEMTNGLFWLIPLGFAISLWSALLLAVGKHRNTLFEAVPALILLVALLLPPGWLPEPLLWGTVAGFAVHAALLAISVRRSGELSAPYFTQNSLAWRSFWSCIGIVALGQMLMSITGLVDQFFAIGLSEGALSTLSYANRILSLILGLGATAIGRATLPVFSIANAKGDADLQALALHWAKLAFVIGFIGLLIGWLVAPWGVELLFERGEFSSADTKRVSVILRYSLLQIPFYFVWVALQHYAAGVKDYSLIFKCQIVALASKMIVVWPLVSWMKLSGLIFSTVIMYLIVAAFIYAVTIKNTINRPIA